MRAKDIAVGLLAFSAAAVSLYFAFGKRGPAVNLDPYDVLGVVAAEETAKLVGGKGQVLVFMRDTGPGSNPCEEAELNAFQHTVQRAGLSLATEKVPVDPMLMMSTGGGLPPEPLFKALEARPGVSAVVMFFGFPLLSDPEIQKLKTLGVKTVAISSLRSGYKRLLEQQVLHLAIVPRPDPPQADAPAPKTVRERFAQDYRLVTAADVSWLP